MPPVRRTRTTAFAGGRVGRGPSCVPVDYGGLRVSGLDERTEEGRRRIVGRALGFAGRIGVRVEVGDRQERARSSDDPLTVVQRPPAAFRSNGDWAADLMTNIARAFIAHPREGPNAIESILLYGLGHGRERSLENALAAGLGYLRDQVSTPGRSTGQPWVPSRLGDSSHESLRADLVDLVASGAGVWGGARSPYACARVLTRAHTEQSGSPVILDPAARLQPVNPEPYGDTAGGWFAWHLAETSDRFRGFEPAQFAAHCDEWLAAHTATDLLRDAGLDLVVDGPVVSKLESPEIRGALEAQAAADGIEYGVLVGDQVLRRNRHPLDPGRGRVPPAAAVKPVEFRCLDSRRPGDARRIEDQVLGACLRSGVAVRLRDAGQVSLCHRLQGAPLPHRTLPRDGAWVAHPVSERFRSTEDWAKSLMTHVALAVVTHPRLDNHARLDRFTYRREEDEAGLYRETARGLCARYRLDPDAVDRQARAVSMPARMGRGALVSVDDLLAAGGEVSRCELARRTMWTTLRAARETERCSPEIADAGLVGREDDYAVAIRLHRCSFPRLPAVVRDCERSMARPAVDAGPSPTPSATASDRCVAVAAADSILRSLGVVAVPESGGPAEERDGVAWPPPPDRAALARALDAAGAGRGRAGLGETVPPSAGGGDDSGGSVLDAACEHAAAVAQFVLDPIRHRRADRRLDLDHSLAVDPWRDLAAARLQRSGEVIHASSAPAPERPVERAVAAVISPAR